MVSVVEINLNFQQTQLVQALVETNMYSDKNAKIVIFVAKNT